jgi:hypothetical protein
MERMQVDRLIVMVALSVTLLGSGCATWNKLDKSEKGAIIGGGSGAVLGNAVSPGVGGTIIGGAAGAVGGSLIGNEMDKDD